MPVGPSQITAEVTIHPLAEGTLEPHVRAGVDAARASGIAVELGPSATGLAGDLRQVIEALEAVITAAIDAGASSVDIKVEASDVAEETTDPDTAGRGGVR
jgi:uncharacterized protein YqgV (UPF0045/DUF77 family)